MWPLQAAERSRGNNPSVSGSGSKLPGVGRGISRPAGLSVSVSQNGIAGGGINRRDKYHAKYARLKRLVKNTVFVSDCSLVGRARNGSYHFM